MRSLRRAVAYMLRPAVMYAPEAALAYGHFHATASVVLLAATIY